MRVFAALPLPDRAVEKLGELAAELKARYPDLKVVKPNGMHVTMVFFGELNQERILEVMRVMDSPELKMASIRAVMGGVGQFPPKGQLRKISDAKNKYLPSFCQMIIIACDQAVIASCQFPQ